ncbi:MAG: HNH endonuclease [Neptuniibacter sp.]
MIRMDDPEFSYHKTLKKCKKGITGNNSLKERVTSALPTLKRKGKNYLNCAQTGELFTIKPTLPQRKEDPVVIKELKKSELVNLYETYFRAKKKPARVIYDSLMTSANEKCPFCGGIGRPKNLDHFLPKAFYPQFSVLPHNLIPACRDCNMDGKGDDYPKTKSEQIIHPYLEQLHFFDEQWIFATYTPEIDSEPANLKYFVQAPEGWSDDDKRRVEMHFDAFDLAVRYSKEANARLVTLLPQVEKLKGLELTMDQIKFTMIEEGRKAAPFPNHWEYVMYDALLNDL